MKLKASWNSSKIIDISNITIDLDTRDGILSVIFSFLTVHSV